MRFTNYFRIEYALRAGSSARDPAEAGKIEATDETPEGLNIGRNRVNRWKCAVGT